MDFTHDIVSVRSDGQQVVSDMNLKGHPTCCKSSIFEEDSRNSGHGAENGFEGSNNRGLMAYTDGLSIRAVVDNRQVDLSSIRTNRCRHALHVLDMII